MSDVSKKARRDEAREHARELREIERKRRARNSLLLKIIVGVVLLAIAGGTVWGVYSYNEAVKAAALPKPGPANMLSDGIILQGTKDNQIEAVRTPAIPAEGEPVATDPADYSDVVRIVMYVDLQCPACQAFEIANAEQLGTWVSAGAATLEIHPISFLDNASGGNRYSSRAANAMACVANYAPDNFFRSIAAMYKGQPAEGTSGLTNDEILAILTGDGQVDDENVTKCVNDESFSQWVSAATERSGTPIPNSDPVLPGISQTPTVLVNGILYSGPNEKEAFNTFVTSIATGTYVPAD